MIIISNLFTIVIDERYSRFFTFQRGGAQVLVFFFLQYYFWSLDYYFFALKAKCSKQSHYLLFSFCIMGLGFFIYGVEEWSRKIVQWQCLPLEGNIYLEIYG